MAAAAATGRKNAEQRTLCKISSSLLVTLKPSTISNVLAPQWWETRQSVALVFYSHKKHVNQKTKPLSSLDGEAVENLIRFMRPLRDKTVFDTLTAGRVKGQTVGEELPEHTSASASARVAKVVSVFLHVC